MIFKTALLCCLIFLSNSLIAQDIYFYQNNKKAALTPLPALIRSNSLETEQAVDYYSTEQGHKVGVYNKLIIKFKDSDGLDPYLLLSPYNVEIEKQLGALLYLVSVPSNKLTIDIANRLTEQGFIEYAHPDFIKQYRMR